MNFVLRWLGPLLAGAALSLAVGAVFLIDVAAPRLLANFLPHHHCPYDLVPQAPASVAAVAIFLGDCFCVGWACLAAWLGRHAKSRPFLAVILSCLLYLAFLGYLSSSLMISVELLRT